jgi:uncharacterized membrane protein YqgA involved in biofilm formation
MTDTLINTATVLVGSAVGTFLRSRFPDGVRQMMIWGVGLISLVIGLQMRLSTKNLLIVLDRILVCGILGELIRRHEGLSWLGDTVQAKFSADEDSTVSQGICPRQPALLRWTYDCCGMDSRWPQRR